MIPPYMLNIAQFLLPLRLLTLSVLQKALEGEKEAKGQSLQRRTELDSQLEKTMKSLDAVSAEKELTKATLTDTQKDLEKEKKAGAALGEHVITLSKQLEDQTARAVKTEDTSKHLQKGVTRASPRATQFAHCGSFRLLLIWPLECVSAKRSDLPCRQHN